MAQGGLSAAPLYLPGANRVSSASCHRHDRFSSACCPRPRCCTPRQLPPGLDTRNVRLNRNRRTDPAARGTQPRCRRRCRHPPPPAARHEPSLPSTRTLLGAHPRHREQAAMMLVQQLSVALEAAHAAAEPFVGAAYREVPAFVALYGLVFFAALPFWRYIVGVDTRRAAILSSCCMSSLHGILSALGAQPGCWAARLPPGPPKHAAPGTSLAAPLVVAAEPARQPHAATGACRNWQSASSRHVCPHTASRLTSTPFEHPPPAAAQKLLNEFSLAYMIAGGGGLCRGACRGVSATVVVCNCCTRRPHAVRVRCRPTGADSDFLAFFLCQPPPPPPPHPRSLQTSSSSCFPSRLMVGDGGCTCGAACTGRCVEGAALAVPRSTRGLQARGWWARQAPTPEPCRALVFLPADFVFLIHHVISSVYLVG